jgi:uncharacterized membrane protein
MRRHVHASRQRGSVVVMAAIAISTMVILLATIDIGYLFFQKREMQKVADMAALAGAQQLSRVSNDQCASAFSVARGSAQVGQGFTGTLTISCGRWDPTMTGQTHFQVYPNGVTPNGASAPSAVSVLTSRNFRSFFGAWVSRDITALAIATADAPIAVFSVGSRLLRINGGVVPGILSRLGVDISGTALASYNGLANVNVTPGGLLRQLGFQIPAAADVGTIKQAVLANVGGCSNGVCPLEALLGAVSTVAGQQNLVSALGLSVTQLNLPVQLFSDATGRGGIFALVNTASGQSALTANVNALELLTTMIGVANGHRFADVPLGVSVPGVLNSQIKVGIVEPPSIGIGGVGTTAFTSQVRLFSRIQAPAPPVSAALSNLLSVDLPMAIDVVNGQGTITAMCNGRDASGNQTATIAVTAPILQACIGNIDGATAFSTTTSCEVGLQNKQMLSFLGGTLSINDKVVLKALDSNGSVTLSKGQTATVGNNNLPIGTTVSNLTNAVLVTLLGKLLNNKQGSVTDNNLATALLSADGNVLQTTLNTLKGSLSSLQTFINNLNSDVTTIAGGSLGSGVVSLLNSVGGLVNGLLTGVGNLLNSVIGGLLNLLFCNSHCQVQNQLSGNSSNSAVSNVLLALMGILEKLLEPILNGLGGQIASLLNNLLGIGLGQVDVTLIDLKCGGGDNVKLVF